MQSMLCCHCFNEAVVATSLELELSRVGEELAQVVPQPVLEAVSDPQEICGTFNKRFFHFGCAMGVD